MQALFFWLIKNWHRAIPLIVTVLSYLCMHVYGEFKYNLAVDRTTAEMQQVIENQKREFEHRLELAEQSYLAERNKLLEREKVQRDEIEQLTKNPVYSNDCFDDDGVQGINRAAGY